jgi:penicillin-binding protein 1B
MRPMFRRRLFGQIEPRRSKFWRYFRYAFLALALFAASFTLYLDFRVRGEFEGRRFAIPARIYARPLELHAGLRITQGDVIDELRENNYHEGIREGDSGWFVRDGEWLEIAVRPFRFWDGPQNALRVRVNVDANGVQKVQNGQGLDLPLARLEPVAIGGIYPGNNQDRVLVRLSEVPKPLVQALIATEDRAFYTHHGYDLRGIARAAWSFVRGHGLQGGSTLTQQLVKNFFLTPERTLQRKGTEFIMAVLLELHYGKEEILETYLNEIYLGQDRDRAIHGIGLASLTYFGKSVDRLTLPEGALLVAMVKGPGVYDPYRHADRALERRNLVLREMRNTNAITPEEYMLARQTSLGVNAKASMGTSPHPAFVDLVYRHLRRDYDEADLRSEGLRIFTTLDPRVQNKAEQVLERRIAQFDRDKRFGDPGLEGAVVVTDSQTGEVEALVGGHDPRYRGFNRALDAARPVGSLLKPAIYLTALADPAHYTLVTPLDDGPFVWKSRGAPDWEPMNFDRQYHGAVPLRTALAQSYNVATARLGTDLGISRVFGTLQRLGIEREMQPYASTLLGALDLSPLEVTQMYQTIATGGFRAPLRAIREVTTQDGKPLKRYPLAVEQAFAAEPVYLITAAMQGVVREGTGQSLKNWLPPETAAAGKTGTTDEQRDAWFAGFTGDKLAIVWIGYDDNRAARLTGAGAALPVWGELMASLAPEPLALPKPEGIETVRIDPASGLRADAGCDGSLELPFASGSAPTARAPCATAVGIVIEDVKQTTKNWWQRLWGR